MFTGIIQTTGRVSSIAFSGGAAKVTIEAPVDFWSDAFIGDSIAIDGVCLTIKEKNRGSCAFDVSGETLKKTILGGYRTSTVVNMEKALRLSDRLGGHFVQGHVDGVGKYMGKKVSGENVELDFFLPEELSRYVVEKGSIAINGISLTAARVKGNVVTVAVIPHTLEITSLSIIAAASPINIECDIIAKYTEKLLLSEKRNKSINSDFLREKGFI